MHLDQLKKSLRIHKWNTGFLNLSPLHFLHNSQPVTVMTATKWWLTRIFKHFWLQAGHQKQHTARQPMIWSWIELYLGAVPIQGNWGQYSWRLHSVSNRNISFKKKCRAHEESQNPFYMHGNTPQQSAVLLPVLAFAQKRLSRREGVLQSTHEISRSMGITAAFSSKCFNRCKNMRN